MQRLLRALRELRDHAPGKNIEVAAKLGWNVAVLSGVLTGNRPLTLRRLQSIIAAYPELQPLVMEALVLRLEARVKDVDVVDVVDVVDEAGVNGEEKAAS